ncbi:NAD(P)-dependent alcohol dehydrogenase [Funiculus sociatus GB2-A5]|uniref:NAD(P)-dependent alcohol dehydrogenase n=1 Tax=Funiculus sociatus GB2-A5 TaxID=2933946 RepID=A0ABV0JU97_9CYAN|nr:MULTISPECIES: NAD(P)-dependent alcohol dehydrogenase [unclassified Trichocoleus]MBD1908528.1 NAD(P)-dependent alcohol dehydrogenase [Trichocoleus sp. FACHB-832]MBD2065277.1 NAD(P)-dependent alcohol dehydrogenase [Trichocoleus sp. FACHB-6]
MQIQALAAQQQGATLQPYEFAVEPPQAHDCVIKVLACGICHSDLHMIDNDWETSNYPLVPGHEVIGEVVEIGSQVNHIKTGDRVGVGWQRSSCLQCRDCLRGNENLCDENQGLIVTGPGGFADYLMVDSRFAFPIPAGIETKLAGPLLCAGITVYAALRSAGMTSGQEIGVIGVGGLGHLAVQFASRLGNSVTVFTTSDDKAEFAHQLGARHTVVVPGGTPPAPTQKLNILLSTVPASVDWAAYLEHLDSDGTLVLVGVPSEPLNVPIGAMLNKRRRIMASPIGGRAMMLEMLSVAEKYGIQPLVEVFPFEQANEAMQKVRDNKVRYRAVLAK